MKDADASQFVQEADGFLKSHQDEIQKQIEDSVVFYNVKDKKAFFVVAPEEARFALDTIKQRRIDRGVTWQRRKKQDEFVFEFIDALEIWESDRDDTRIARAEGFEIWNTSIESMSPSGFIEMTVAGLNQAFVQVEARDRMVYALIMNAKAYGIIRKWGATLYKEYTAREVLERNVFGQIWTSEIYITNKIKDPNMIFLVGMWSKEKDFSKSHILNVKFTAPEQHRCQITSLKDQAWFKRQKKKKGLYMFCQHLSNLQVATDDGFYHEASVNLRGAIAEDDKTGQIFDVAANPVCKNKGEALKIGYLALLKEKITNDLVTYNKMLEKLIEEGMASEEEHGIALWEVAANIIRVHEGMLTRQGDVISHEDFTEFMKAQDETNMQIKGELKALYEKYHNS